MVYATRQEGPELTSGIFDLGQTYRFDSDYVGQGTATKWGPAYWEQTEAQTCELFVHESAEGLPADQHDIWTGRCAPCSAWRDLGLVDACCKRDEVTWEFSSAVNSPWIGDDFTKGAQPLFDRKPCLPSPHQLRGGGPKANERTGIAATGIDTGGGSGTTRHPQCHPVGRPTTGIDESEQEERT